MEISQSVAYLQVVDDSDTSSTSSEESLITIAPNERTPLLLGHRVSASASAHDSSSPSFSSSMYTKECLNWRIIGLLVMFTTGLGVASYLLWLERPKSPDNDYQLSLTQHDLWSLCPLQGQALLEAGKVVNVYITHTGGVECTENCAQLLHTLQHQHLGELPYNFLMAGDCEAYEARGWRYASNYGTLPQSSSLVLAFVGNFTQQLPSSCQLEMAEALLWESQRRRKLQPRYQLYALRNVSRSEFDADALQRKLRQWPLYAGLEQVK
ncbi:peptidoglycan-recognition protein LD isoform X1 [Drosophila nasuta]|uniref:peptidoglycan-recognition protein LD isoform X1 n=1 Tax=Drosophila nasuta TaxID=42062 RepID=UPI00295E7307|nr:peptidoglycan-recognition protein LD isoform X1 [Drosophila nasuta]